MATFDEAREQIRTGGTPFNLSALKERIRQRIMNEIAGYTGDESYEPAWAADLSSRNPIRRKLAEANEFIVDPYLKLPTRVAAAGVRAIGDLPETLESLGAEPPLGEDVGTEGLARIRQEAAIEQAKSAGPAALIGQNRIAKTASVPSQEETPSWLQPVPAMTQEPAQPDSFVQITDHVTGKTYTIRRPSGMSGAIAPEVTENAADRLYTKTGPSAPGTSWATSNNQTTPYESMGVYERDPNAPPMEGNLSMMRSDVTALPNPALEEARVRRLLEQRQFAMTDPEVVAAQATSQGRLQQAGLEAQSRLAQAEMEGDARVQSAQIEAGRPIGEQVRADVSMAMADPNSPARKKARMDGVMQARSHPAYAQMSPEQRQQFEMKSAIDAERAFLDEFNRNWERGQAQGY